MVLLVRAFAWGMLLPRAHDRGLQAAEPITIDVNHASLGELTALPGIGPSRARSIVLFRLRHGPFASVDQIAAVDGIGSDTVAELRPYAVALPIDSRR